MIINIHDLDQLLAGLRDLAEVLHGYKEQLIKQGFNQREALQLVINYQAILLNNQQKGKRD